MASDLKSGKKYFVKILKLSLVEILKLAPSFSDLPCNVILILRKYPCLCQNNKEHITPVIIKPFREQASRPPPPWVRTGQSTSHKPAPPSHCWIGVAGEECPKQVAFRPTPPLLRRSVCSWTMSCSYGELETNQLPLYPSFSSQTGILSSFNLCNIYAILAFLTLEAFTDRRAVT